MKKIAAPLTTFQGHDKVGSIETSGPRATAIIGSNETDKKVRCENKNTQQRKHRKHTQNPQRFRDDKTKKGKKRGKKGYKNTTHKI